MKIAVIDGQGGGFGRAIIEKLRMAEKCGSISGIQSIIALGTNSSATQAMLKAGADAAATGENAIIYNAAKADYIIGPVGIISANSLHGELSPNMANAVCNSTAVKILIPFQKCNIYLTGVESLTLAEHLEHMVQYLINANGL